MTQASQAIKMPADKPAAADSSNKKCDCKMSYISKTGSVILAFALIVLGVLNLINVFSIVSPLDYILSVYYIIFGLILLATLWKMRPILKYFGFIYTFFGKALFDFFLATMVWTDAGTFNYILAICFAVVGVINIILTCTNKSEYEQFSRQLRQELLTKEFSKGMKLSMSKT